MKKFIFTLIIMLTAQSVYALDVVYPKKNTVTINANSTFFIGSSDPKKKLTINGQNVPVHSSGGFAYVVQLNTGGNNFNIKSGSEQLNFTITRPSPKAAKNIPEPLFKEYDNIKYGSVINDNSPLRSTPIDSGINRIAHLQKGMPLSIDGEKGDFYRVIIGSSRTGWINKSNIRFNDSGTSLATLNGYDYIDTDDFFIFVFHLDKMTPFELEEGEPFKIKLFNVADKPDNTYIMDFPIHESFGGKKLLGYSARFSGTDFIVKIRKPVLTDLSKPLKGMKIAIDAGHGGNETGAVGCLRDYEKDLNLAFAKQLEQELKHRGADVFMTRNSDINLGLKERVEMANDENALLLISLHGNALADGEDPNKRSGTSIYYYYPQAKNLAYNIITTMTSQLGINNDKVHQRSFALVRNTNALSILIEIGYVINPQDNAKMRDKNFQKATAKAIADGIEQFFKN
ncbi:TPA: N-acetylmuramoyl-L-alanine amidase [Candidatus Scatousia excrementigallinarum]|uniref:N-acetylmuramoyl-L-alanine amidase n=1 Tax=Candidatus Scatousia excrementigallinarum TaxID=2840935 RepID=A0A9D1JM74_9BACT|nr:N-acetylmuramoyl-L-alanine amidase [Candidatus Scatousia excrementigallinarum]